MTFVQFNHPYRFLDNREAYGALIENARNRLVTQFSALDAAIAGAPYFLPRGLTALDFYLYMLTEFFDDRQGLFRKRPKLAALHDAISIRDCVSRIRQRHG